MSMSTHYRIISGPEFTAAEILETARARRLLSLELELSRRCNFRCTYCYVGDDGMAPAGDELTAAEVRDVVRQAKALGARKIILLGGEPMIHPDILATVRWLHEEGLAVELFTNGSKITPETAAELFRHEVAVVLKMNSFDAATQDALAGRKGAYDIIQTAFANLRAAGYPSPRARLCVSSIICKQNLHEMRKMWQWARERDIEPYLELITPQANAACNRPWLDVSREDARALFHDIADMDRTRFGRAWEPQPPLVGNKCLRHLFSCLVTATGDVMPCVGVTIPVGNVRRQPLRDILADSEVIQDLRDHRHTMQGACAACDKAEDCYGCRGAAYQVTGNYLASDPLCWRIRDTDADIGARLPAAAAPFLPQQPPMRIVDRLESVGERSAVVETVIPADSPFVLPDGRVDEAVHLELIAQAMAALNGFRLRPENRAKAEGLLLGARQLRVAADVRAGDPLRIEVQKIARLDAFGIIRGRVTCNGGLVAEGEIKVFHRPEPAAPAAPAQ